MPYYFLGTSILLAAIIIFTGLVMTRDSGPADIYVNEVVSQAPQPAAATQLAGEALAPEPEPVKEIPAPKKEEPKPKVQAAKPAASAPAPAATQPTVSAPVVATPAKHFITLPNGTVVEVDAQGNVIGSVAGAQTAATTTSSTSSKNIVLPNGTILDASGQVISRAAGDTRQYVLLPGGAVLDAQGNVVLSASAANPSAATATTTSSQSLDNLSPGATVQISRTIALAVGYNPNLTCQQLGFTTGNNLTLCNLYRDHEDEYKWVFVE